MRIEQPGRASVRIEDYKTGAIGIIGEIRALDRKHDLRSVGRER
jgi:hypothetical protein